jgi:hypothetical protein
MALIGTITEGKRARELFVGREDLILEFLRRVHSESANVMFVYGEGGIGKSLLLHHLEDHYCRVLTRPEGRLLDPWTKIGSLPASELVRAFEGLAPGSSALENAAPGFALRRILQHHLNPPQPGEFSSAEKWGIFS